MNTTENIQDKFLGQFKADQTKVVVFLVNGFQMKGIIEDYDKYLVCLLSQFTNMRLVHLRLTIQTLKRKRKYYILKLNI